MPDQREPPHLRPNPTQADLEDMERRLPGSDATAARPVLRLLNLARSISERLLPPFQEIGLTEARFSVVMMINWAESQTIVATPSGLAEYTGVGRASMTQLLDGLEDTGWVERTKHPEDRRKLAVELTATGRRKLERFLPDHYARVSSLLGNLTPTERDQLVTLLDKIDTALQTTAEE
jgi:DNA-binding MarR family transcriptional regulator